MRVAIGTEGWTGHTLPALALGRALRERGHEVLLHSSERWASVAAELGMEFARAPERIAESVAGGGSLPTIAQAADELLPALEEFRAEMVVSDLFTLAPALAAEAAGLRRASLVPHFYPVDEPGLPFPLQGFRPPRGGLGRLGWRALTRARLPALRRGRSDLNRARAELGLEPVTRFHAAISDELVLVATYPGLEYPRRWPSHVHVTGPMFFETPHPEVTLPESGRPLVLVAASTSQDPGRRLVSTALEALEPEPVDVVATINRPGEDYGRAVPTNATVVDWISYSQAMPRASLVVCNGGHGTVTRALSEATPVLVCPAGGDQAENGARVAWAGAGLMLPGRLVAAGSLRRAAARILSDDSFAGRARAFADWSRVHDGAGAGAGLVESVAAAVA